MAVRTVEDHWLPPEVPVRDVNEDIRGFRPPKDQKTYRRCTVISKNRKGESVQCEEVAIVLWSQRHDPAVHKGKCRKHGGPK